MVEEFGHSFKSDGHFATTCERLTKHSIRWKEVACLHRQNGCSMSNTDNQENRK